MGKLTDLTDNLIETSLEFWTIESDVIKNLVYEDAKDGIFQNNTSGYSYSPEYAKRKANNFRSMPKNKKPGGKAKVTKGKRLSGFKGISIASNDVSKVTMILTGQTISHLKGKPNKYGTEMIFDSKDAMKVIGNQRLGYDLIGLNDKNVKIVADDVFRELQKNIKKKLTGKGIKIFIGK